MHIRYVSAAFSPTYSSVFFRLSNMHAFGSEVQRYALYRTTGVMRLPEWTRCLARLGVVNTHVAERLFLMFDTDGDQQMVRSLPISARNKQTNKAKQNTKNEVAHFQCVYRISYCRMPRSLHVGCRTFVWGTMRNGKVSPTDSMISAVKACCLGMNSRPLCQNSRCNATTLSSEPARTCSACMGLMCSLWNKAIPRRCVKTHHKKPYISPFREVHGL
eukprot:COSAG05_NODE_317_length_11545_cov_73.981391_19_plen_217_part_00